MSKATMTAEANLTNEKLAMGRFRKHVEQKVLAAPDERTRAIRLFVLAAAEVALKNIEAEIKAGEEGVSQ